VPGRNASSGSISRLGPHFADRRSGIALPGLSNFQPRISNLQNSNRECFRRVRAVNRLCDCRAIDSGRRYKTTGSNREAQRLEPAVTQRKQRIETSSNREKEAYSSAAPTATLDGEIKKIQTPRWDSRAGTPTSGVAGAASKAPLRRQRRKRGREKTKSRPPTFVAIRKNYVTDFIRLKGGF
jgi:hypothetical protein